MGIETRQQLREVQEFVRNNVDSLSEADLAEIDSEVRAFNLRVAEQDPRAVVARPPVESPGDLGIPLAAAVPDFPGAEAVDVLRQAGAGALSGVRDFLDGIVQGSASGLAQQGVPGAQEALSEVNRQRNVRKAGEEEAVRQFRGPEQGGTVGLPFQIGEVAGGAAPEITTTLATRNISGPIKRALTDTAIGAAAGAAQFVEEDQSRAANTLMGLGFGLAGGVPAGVSTAARTALTRDITSSAVTRESEEIEAIAQRMGVELLPSQATRSPTLRSIETRIDTGAGSPRDIVLNRQSVQLQDSFRRKAQDLTTRQLSVEDTAKGMQNAVEGHVKQLADVRRANWQNEMAKAVTVSGNARVLVPRETERVATELLTQLDVPGTRASTDLGRLDGFITDIREEITNGGMTAQRFQEMVVQMNDQVGSPTGLFKDLSKAQQRHVPQTLVNAMLKDMEEAAASGVPGAAEIANARLVYGLDSSVIDDLRSNGIERLFGKALGTDLDEGTFSQKLLALKPNEARSLIGAMDQVDPLVSDQMRSALVTDLLDSHRLFTAGDAPGDFNMAGFFRDFTQGRGKTALVDVLYPDDKELRDGFRVMGRLLFGEGSATPGRDVVAQAREVAVTAGSAVTGQSNLGFILRLVTGIATDRQLEALMFSPDSLQRIRALAKPGAVDATSQVVVDLASELERTVRGMNEADAAREERQRNLQMQEAINRQAIQ
jgi:hypothetical protein